MDFFMLSGMLVLNKKFCLDLLVAAGTLTQTNSIQNLKQQITNQPIVNCSEITWAVFGLSAATFNAFLLLFFLIFNTMFIVKHFYDTQQKLKLKKYIQIVLFLRKSFVLIMLENMEQLEYMMVK